MFPKIALILSLILAAPAWAAADPAQTTRQIMTEVERVARQSYSTAVHELKLVSCKYGKKDGKTVCTEKPRTKRIESVELNTGKEQQDSKTVLFIQEPIGEKGVALLTFEFDARDKDNISWLYLPIMGKVKKIISSDPDDDLGSFFGSEFCLEDFENIEKIDADDYTYPHIKEDEFQGRPIWIIEAVPVKAHHRQTRYGKMKLWVDREYYVVWMLQLFNKQLKPYKQIIMDQLEQIDGVWTMRQILVKNLISERMSALLLKSVRFNVEVPPQFLTRRALVDFAYRERELSSLRTYLQAQ